MGISHQVKVFVFRVLGSQVDFLLVRKWPIVEHSFGPVRGTIKVEERPKEAVLREVREETGLIQPAHLIDLHHVSSLVFGEEALCEWEFGYQVSPLNLAKEIEPRGEVVDSLWAGFDRAFDCLEMPEDRSALVRLKMTLEAG